MPAGQALHVLFDSAPSRKPNVPAGHAVQLLVSTAPTSGLKVPRGQGMHEDSNARPRPAAYLPGTHCVQTVAFPLLYEPAGQEPHSSEEGTPVTLEKEPGGQGAQLWDRDAAPAIRPCMPAGQGAHVAASTWPA